MASMKCLVFVGFLAVTGCGGGGGGDGDDVGGPDAPVLADAAAGWQSLVEGDWSLQPNQEDYYCVYATVPRDVYVKAFRPLIPVGTHHTVLTLYSGSHPDGTVTCDAGTNGQSMIYGSGVGSPDFAFPAGVGLHLAAGQRLLLNLHLYNATDGVLTGRSGTLFAEATAAEIQNEAELVLAGPTFQLNVPPGTSTQSGTCHVNNITDADTVHVFALSQHMHTLGRHMRTTLTRGTDVSDLQNIDYAFESQTFQYVDPTVALMPGDVITTYCTYDNPNGYVVHFGESTLDEMCFTDLFYYPAQGAAFICTGVAATGARGTR